MASRRPWWPPTKVAGKYLGPYLSRMGGEDPGVKELEDLSPAPDRGAGSAEHELAIALVLSAADADAAMGEFENALRWLAFVEQLDFVVPAPYVARRFEWRRELEPGLAPDAAAARIDPAFESADAAMTDLYRRIGWFREFEHRTEGDMQGRLSNFDAGLEELNALVKRAGILDASGGYSRQ